MQLELLLLALRPRAPAISTLGRMHFQCGGNAQPANKPGLQTRDLFQSSRRNLHSHLCFF